tara:strand:+ start:11202 stop:12089 length:888 start_codon:yes stop_codon:yes gene_type:complete
VLILSKIKKVIFPVAGLGSRFLPATKIIPKEMLPVVDIPQIQLALEEAVASGAEEAIFITSRGKESIVDHFDIAYELKDRLMKNNQYEVLSSLEELTQKIRIVSVRQDHPLGLGHALLCAEKLIGEESFAVVLSDDLIRSKVPVIKQMMDVSISLDDAPVISIMKVAGPDISKYGVIEGEETTLKEKRLLLIKDVVEKPKFDEAPSDLAIIGRYIFNPDIFECINKVKPDTKGEVQLTDAIKMLLDSKQVYGYEFEGKRYDAGSKIGFIKANIEYGLSRRDIGDELREYLHNLNF